MRAMSAQKRDLSRRLKAAESSNRQLRGELQHYRTGLRGLTPAALQSDPHPGCAGDVRGMQAHFSLSMAAMRYNCMGCAEG